MKPELGHPGMDGSKAYLVGGGIASLASAAYLIRDGGMPGERISILEATNVIGGSLDGEGSSEHNYDPRRVISCQHRSARSPAYP